MNTEETEEAKQSTYKEEQTILRLFSSTFEERNTLLFYSLASYYRDHLVERRDPQREHRTISLTSFADPLESLVARCCDSDLEDSFDLYFAFVLFASYSVRLVNANLRSLVRSPRISLSRFRPVRFPSILWNLAPSSRTVHLQTDSRA